MGNAGKLYDDVADDFFAWEPSREFEFIFKESFQRVVSRIKKPASEIRIFEAGAGHGTWLKRVKMMGFSNVAGMDASEKRVALSKKYLGADCVVHGDILMDVYGGEFDVIFSCEVFQHLTPEEIRKIIDKWDEHSCKEAVFFSVDKDKHSWHSKVVEMNKRAGAAGRKILKLLRLGMYDKKYAALFRSIRYPDFNEIAEYCSGKGYHVEPAIHAGEFTSLVFSKGLKKNGGFWK